MAIVKRGNGYRVDMWKHGKRQRVTCATMEEAKNVASKIEASATLVMVDKNWTLQKGFDECYAEEWKGKGGETSAVQRSLEAIEFFGANTPLSEITPDFVSAYISRLKQIGNAGATINRKISAVSKIISYAFYRGKVSHALRFHRQKESEGRIRFLTNDEEEQGLALLTQWGKDEHAEAVCVLVDSGLRPSELWRLEERDLNLENNTMSVWQTKSGKPRTVPMTKRVQEIMGRRTELTLKGQRLFPFDNYWMNHAWERMRFAMDLSKDEQFVPYALRHTCASRLVQRGVHMRVVQEWMGHANITMTMRYAHLSPKNLLEAVKVLEAC